MSGHAVRGGVCTVCGEQADRLAEQSWYGPVLAWLAGVEPMADAVAFSAWLGAQYGALGQAEVDLPREWHRWLAGR